MRFLLGLIVVLALGWSGYWFVGAGAARSGFETWFDARRADGWVAEYDTLDINGFPNRFDAGFTDISLADPETGLAWEAPFFQILALSYKPNHVIAVWPDRMRLATPLRKYDLQSGDMRASLVLEPDTGLGLDRATLVAKGLVVMPVGTDEPWRAGSLTLAVEQVPADSEPNYHLGLEAQGLAPPAAWLRKVAPDGGLPDRFETLRADLQVTFDKPWNRSAIEEARPQPRAIRLKLAEATWGQLSLQAAGTVSVDARGLPTGTVTIKAQNWREIVRLARDTGTVNAALLDTVEDGLALLSRVAGNPRTLDIPLEFARGQVWLGPVPLGPAPVLRLR